MNKYKISGFRSVRDKERFCLELSYEIRIRSQEMRGLTFESEKEIGYLMDKVKNKNLCQGLKIAVME
ncbi:MAG: hypothetical protein K5857_03700 [Lachnospiraceae bacterium]|nr:hypothetical protein [Lachnospiraceae bacterium]